jgi:hypothetical protein
MDGHSGTLVLGSGRWLVFFFTSFIWLCFRQTNVLVASSFVTLRGGYSFLFLTLHAKLWFLNIFFFSFLRMRRGKRSRRKWTGKLWN